MRHSLIIMILQFVVRSTEEIFGILTRNANEKDIDVNLINWE